jgi:alkanesulfonate monooxygenase SsuD/methylene tetrahydromethanopterin reductase-like flavin-dependent oxidoreductase (luciferase family)
MDFGTHLPLLDFGNGSASLTGLREFATEASRLGYKALSSNDHMVFSRPWLDGLVALSAVIDCSGDMELGTTVSLPVIRGPVALVKALTAIDILSKGRLFAGVGPGSSAKDYETVGIPFDQRWKRLDEAVVTMRHLWNADAEPPSGHYYSAEDIELKPEPFQKSGPPIWIGSWGSAAGLRRTARLGDGWLASAYNTTPEDFHKAWVKLQQLVGDTGKDVSTFPNALATMWCYVSEDKTETDRIMTDVLVPVIRRKDSELRGRVLVGNSKDCASILRAYRDAGLQRVMIWPLADELNQLKIFKEKVAPLI